MDQADTLTKMPVNYHRPLHDVTKQDGRNTYDDTGDMMQENADAHGQAVKRLIIISLSSPKNVNTRTQLMHTYRHCSRQNDGNKTLDMSLLVC